MELKKIIHNGKSVAIRCNSPDEVIAFAYYADSQGYAWCTDVKFVDKDGLTKPTKELFTDFLTVAFFIYRPERRGFTKTTSSTPHGIDVWLDASDFISVPDVKELLDLL